MTDQRNSYGFPLPEERGYLPREQAQLQDRPFFVELYEEAPSGRVVEIAIAVAAIGILALALFSPWPMWVNWLSF